MACVVYRTAFGRGRCARESVGRFRQASVVFLFEGGEEVESERGEVIMTGVVGSRARHALQYEERCCLVCVSGLADSAG